MNIKKNNNKEIFLQRRKDFHEYAKEQILEELNKAGSFHWTYEDGYFYSYLNDSLLLLKSEFENYVFNSLFVLADEGHAIEMEVYSPKDAVETALGLLGEEEVLNGDEE
jgi:hypothetical protein